MKNLDKKSIIIAVLICIILIGLSFWGGIEYKAYRARTAFRDNINQSVETVTKALNAETVIQKDATVTTAMKTFLVQMEMYSVNQGGGYNGANCSSVELSSACDSIRENTGGNPTINLSQKNYCAYVKLPSGNGYYCVDSTGSESSTTTNPNKAGYCDGKAFNCPPNNR